MYITIIMHSYMQLGQEKDLIYHKISASISTAVKLQKLLYDVVVVLMWTIDIKKCVFVVWHDFEVTTLHSNFVQAI